MMVELKSGMIINLDNISYMIVKKYSEQWCVEISFLGNHSATYINCDNDIQAYKIRNKIMETLKFEKWDI